MTLHALCSSLPLFIYLILVYIQGLSDDGLIRPSSPVKTVHDVRHRCIPWLTVLFGVRADEVLPRVRRSASRPFPNCYRPLVSPAPDPLRPNRIPPWCRRRGDSITGKEYTSLPSQPGGVAFQPREPVPSPSASLWRDGAHPRKEVRSLWFIHLFITRASDLPASHNRSPRINQLLWNCVHRP